MIKDKKEWVKIETSILMPKNIKTSTVTFRTLFYRPENVTVELPHNPTFQLY